MTDDSLVTLRDLNQPEGAERTGHLISADSVWADLEVADGGEPVSSGSMLGIQTSETIYLGRVESGEIQGKGQRLRIRIHHWLALQDVSSIQKLWSQEQSD